MSTQDTTPSERPIPPGLRPWKKGQSGNPGGQPKWVKKVRKALGQHAERAAEVLREVMDTGEPKERVMAAKVVLEFSVPKPTDKTGAANPLDSRPVQVPPSLAAKLAALDS